MALGERCDIRDFYDAVMKPGASPFPLTAKNVVATVDEVLARALLLSNADMRQEPEAASNRSIFPLIQF